MNRKNGKDGKGEAHGPEPEDSHGSPSHHPVIPPRGDPATLKSFQKAEVIYDFTFRFTHKFLSRGDRTVDQMIQAGRSGKKNLLEGGRLGRHEKDFIQQGGLREPMTRARIQAREQQRNAQCHGKHPKP